MYIVRFLDAQWCFFSIFTAPDRRTAIFVSVDKAPREEQKASGY